MEIKLGLGAKPVPTNFIDIKVTVNSERVDVYAEAFVMESVRKAPLLSEKYPISKNEMIAYTRFLLSQRVAQVNGNCPLWRRLKVLYIPDFIQLALDKIGIAIDRTYGIKFVPEFSTDGFDSGEVDGTFDISEAIEFSEKLSLYEDYIHMQKDAMPRKIEGDLHTMSMIAIDGYLRSYLTDCHEEAEAIAAFWNSHVVEDQVVNALFRQTYDPVDYVMTALRSSRSVIVC